VINFLSGYYLYQDNHRSIFKDLYDGLVPLLIVGLLWKERFSEPFQMGKENSTITPWVVRIVVIVGSVLTQFSALGPNRIIIVLVVSTILIIVVSNLTWRIVDPDISAKV
jgi:hypothetical protein